MTTCGMYDYAGGWQFSVGLPAKSGVGGGIMAVQPGQLGIGVFSPLLDATGNSVRGVRVCRDLSQQLCLHMLAHRGNARTVVRRSYRVAEVRSKRQRRAQETALLDREGHRIVVYELQGDLSFPSLESLTRRVIQDLDSAECFILDARRMLWLDAVAGELLGRLAERLRAHGRRLVICELPPSVAGSLLEEVVGAEVTADLDATHRGRGGCAAAAPGRRRHVTARRSWIWPRSTSSRASHRPSSTLLRPHLIAGRYRRGRGDRGRGRARRPALPDDARPGRDQRRGRRRAAGGSARSRPATCSASSLCSRAVAARRT